ncbi:MAG: hypothetical protein PHG40_02035 [Candidatus Omnitrophica bacterium]|nr:hypothetical protein [Candidatus Omnitrophota bacterium]
MDKKIIEAPFDSYYGVFLTMACSFSCEYCVQKISLPQQPVASYPIIPGEDWVEALNSISGRARRKFLRPTKKKKLSITGGEPTLHPDFVYILNHLDKDWRITVTSNFISPFFQKDAPGLKQIKRKRGLKFNASFHFLYTTLDKFIENVQKVKKAGLLVHTLFIVAHPAYMDKIQQCRDALLEVHPNVKLQRFLGYSQGRLYPAQEGYDIEYQQRDGIYNYKDYQAGFNQQNKQDIYCRMNKVLFAPNGDIYNCHYKLYTGHKEKLGNLFRKGLHIALPADYFLCHDYGFCNPCDSEGHSFRRLDGSEFNISA